MKVLISALRRYVEFCFTVPELADKLTDLGFEVESCDHIVPSFSGVVCAKVLEKKTHPNADRLSICLVDYGEDPVTVVCGAPNVAAGQYVPFATIGARLPNGMVIKETPLRGVVSKGMICSEKELDLGDDSAGIMVLDGKPDLGIPAEVFLDLEDWVLDISVTPNRADCLSLVGLARETALLDNTKFIADCRRYIPDSLSPKEAGLSVDIRNTEACPLYTGAVVSGVSVLRSPFWLRKFLTYSGIRAINTIVDITNYVLMETGQPLHAFDQSFIEGGGIIIRNARKGETVVTLDGKERGLAETDLVIADTAKAVALAGIMGCENSEIQPETTDIILESAYFSPVTVRRTSSRLGLKTESSSRFERGVDPFGVCPASHRALELIKELSPGCRVHKTAGGAYYAGSKTVSMDLSLTAVNGLLGTAMDAKSLGAVLDRFDFHPEETKKGGFSITVPTYRSDLRRETDLVEEVARVYGYDKIPVANTCWSLSTITARAASFINPLLQQTGDVPLAARYGFIKTLRQFLAGRGFREVLTPSFILFKDIADRASSASVVSIANLHAQESYVMRPELISPMLKVLSHNINYGAEKSCIFEIGKVYRERGENIYIEEDRVCIIMYSNKPKKEWYEREPLCYDMHSIQGIVESLTRRFLTQDIRFEEDSDAVFEEGRAYTLKAGDISVGRAGEIRMPDTIQNSVLCAELKIDELLGLKRKRDAVRELPKFPAVARDIAIVVDEKVTWQRVKDCVCSTGIKEIESVELFDVYTGEQIEKSKKSMAFRVLFRSETKTLKEDEVTKGYNRIVEKLERELRCTVR